VAGLLLPIYIKKLDFKTFEELQSMPQTEEEHLENQYLDYEDKEKSITDAEVSLQFYGIIFDFPSQHLKNIFSILFYQNFNTLRSFY
jgi:hypothetical protein